MKNLQLDLNKRLLIVEAISNGIADAWVFNSYGLKTMLNSVCEGSEFTEEKARLYLTPTNRIYSPKGWELWFSDFIDGTKHKTSALESFISAIEAAGYYWGENPVKEPRMSDYGWYASGHPEEDSGWMYEEGEDKYYESLKLFEESESRTFNPEKCIIFEIL
ncbi:hypothetical protein [uncultured Chryseobacterium sp.]|uniref:hypothetical protein n=1 Tax=uncultured Chryseobacterium sp. TaxID=259322 RepID=UPI0025903FF5|nr:hypothetical protein [uncultured Chryseobacterium sp.]